MTLRVYLKEGSPHDPGWQAWALDLLGFGTWAPTEREVLAKLPDKVAEHLEWLRQHGERTATLSGDIAVAERLSGDEVLFGPDRLPASPEEIDRTIALIACSRQDLLAAVQGLPDELLDWDPPYERFPDWADWRSVRQVVRHIALCEVAYYLRWIGFDPSPVMRNLPAAWPDLLQKTRTHTFRCLEALKSDPDHSRVIEARGEAWSVRKVLRRLLWHELLHIKNIRRISLDYRATRHAS